MTTRPNNSPQFWPPVEREPQIWQSSLSVAGPRSSEFAGDGERYYSAIPPLIAGLDPTVESETAELAREAESELVRFDSAHGDRIPSFAPILLRSEAAASSQIEQLAASARQIFTAEIGGRSARNATEIVANTRTVITAIDTPGPIDVESIRNMHRVLMSDQRRHTPGEFRDEPVWVGTRSHIPVGAEYVAPDHTRIDSLMDDLARFCRRRDLQPLVHTSLAHAQFETIHPFSDGNGRTGRALAQAMLRRRGLTRNVAVPISAGLLSNIDDYYTALGDYRNGNTDSIVRQFAAATLRAVPNGRTLVAELDAIAADWADSVRARRGSAKQRLLEFALTHPVFTAEIAARAADVAITNVYRALNDLNDQGVLASKGEYQGPMVWRAPAVLQAIDRFAERAGRRSAV